MKNLPPSFNILLFRGCQASLRRNSLLRWLHCQASLFVTSGGNSSRCTSDVFLFCTLQYFSQKCITVFADFFSQYFLTVSSQEGPMQVKRRKIISCYTVMAKESFCNILWYCKSRKTVGKVMRFAQPSYETFARPCIAPYPSSNHQLPNFYGRGGRRLHWSDLAKSFIADTNNISMFLLVLILRSCVMLFKLLLARLESVFFEYFALEFQFFCLIWKNRMRIISMISEKSSFEGGVWGTGPKSLGSRIEN